jgi:hypothetical protein
MNVLEIKQKNEYIDDIKKIMNILKFKNEQIELKGSSSLKSQQYFSDYDFLSKIQRKYNPTEIYNEFRGILKYILDSEELYFMELKIQTIHNEKFRWYPNDNFTLKDFLKKYKDVEFIKLDIIARIMNKFIAVECMYKIPNNIKENMTNIQRKDKINENINDLKKEGKYFKVLKRLMNVYRNEHNDNKILMLSNIFNGNLGELYQKTTNLETVQDLLKYYDDPKTRKKVEINMMDINEPINIKDIEKKIFNKL